MVCPILTTDSVSHSAPPNDSTESFARYVRILSSCWFGILLFLFAYLFTNLGIFAVAIALENKLGTANIADYAGLIRRSPFLAVAGSSGVATFL